VKIIQEEKKGLKLTFPKPFEVPPPKSLSPPLVKCVISLTLSLIIPLDYGLIEKDSQLRNLCGLGNKRNLGSGWKHDPRFIEVEYLKFCFNGWCNSQVSRSRNMFGCLSENFECLPPR